MLTPFSSALTMSYTVSAATVTAVSASISTPVLSTVRTRASTPRVPLPRRASNVTSTFVRRSGWQSGISSEVRLAARIPAVRAVPSTSPFGASPWRTALRVAGFILMIARATASRTVSGLADTSTMRASPRGERCERPRKPSSRAAFRGRTARRRVRR